MGLLGRLVGVGAPDVLAAWFVLHHSGFWVCSKLYRQIPVVVFLARLFCISPSDVSVVGASIVRERI